MTTVELPQACACGCLDATVGPGREAHRSSLRCIDCGEARGSVNIVTWSLAEDLAASPFAPDGAIKIREADWQAPAGQRR
jgi:hypothetical protein